MSDRSTPAHDIGRRAWRSDRPSVNTIEGEVCDRTGQFNAVADFRESLAEHGYVIVHPDDAVADLVAEYEAIIDATLKAVDRRGRVTRADIMSGWAIARVQHVYRVICPTCGFMRDFDTEVDANQFASSHDCQRYRHGWTKEVPS